MPLRLSRQFARSALWSPPAIDLCTVPIVAGRQGGVIVADSYSDCPPSLSAPYLPPGRPANQRPIPVGLRWVRCPLSVPAVGSMTQSISVGRPEASASASAAASSAGVVTE